MSMATDPNLNALWSRAIAEELWRGGCAQVLLCPGSRNSPLLFALAAVFGDQAWTWIDERGAAFAALGAAKACGKPVAICVTSGTAVANCVPALCEAAASGVTLLVLAADRPAELHGRGAPQTMAQHGLAGEHALDILAGDPQSSDAALIALRTTISTATQGGRPCLIHIPLRDPLPPLPDPDFSDTGLGDLARLGRGTDAFVPPSTPAAITACDIPTWLCAGRKGLIVVGANHGGQADHAARVAADCGVPLLADASSGLRGRDCGAPAEILLRGACADESPDWIIRLGSVPLAKHSAAWLQGQTCPVLTIDDGQNRDWIGTASVRVSRPDQHFWQVLGEHLGTGDPSWHDRWHRAAQRIRSDLHAWAERAPWSESLAAYRTVNHAGFARLHLAASMALRHGELHLQRQVPVHANRGVNGIDGCIATFAGAERGRRNGLLLIGDIAFLHDLNSLLLAARHCHGAAIVVLDNDGGGIFDHLPVAQVPGYAGLVRTPQGADLLALAQAAGLDAVRVRDAVTLGAALERAVQNPGCSVVICDVRGLANVEAHRACVGFLAGILHP